MFDTLLQIAIVWIATSFSIGAAWVGLCYGYAALHGTSPGSPSTPRLAESDCAASAFSIVRRLNITPASNH
jgi:hypothetical protein